MSIHPRGCGAVPPSILWLTEGDVTALLSLGEAIDALERGLAAEAWGQARNMDKTHVGWDGGHTLHAIGAAFPQQGFAGTKTWAHADGGATPLLILFDCSNGSLRAIIEAFALGQMRTGGVSGVATRWLARAEADELAIIGTGKQALPQIAAIAAVRPLKRVRVFSPNPAHRTQLIARVCAAFDVEVIEAQSVAEAVDGASMVTLVTRASEPFLSAGMVASGCHINAVGAITPDRAEVHRDVLERCDLVVADSVPAVQTLSREFMDYYTTGQGTWTDVVTLSAVLTAQRRRPDGADLTLFKAMGMGIADLALGIEVYNRAVAQGIGRMLPTPERAPVRFL
jgi:ornithine cyclodeaminase/alanine dehydrogenase-like protein (mu-crystallin family)